MMLEPDMTKAPKPHYSFLAKAFHWGFVLLFAYGIAKQVNDLDQLGDGALLRFEVVFALVFLLLLAARYLYMTKTQTSALSHEAPAYQKIAAKAVHLGLYLSLAAIPLTGLLIAGLFSLGFRQNSLMIQGAVSLHELSVMLSYWLIALHIIAAFYHRFRKDEVWPAMVSLPYFKSRSPFE